MISSRMREQLVSDIATLRGIEPELADPDQLATVRRHLEALVGKTLPRAGAARVLGVSQNTLDRWIRLGDVPVVLTPHGRHEVPRTALVELVADLEGRGGEPHALARVLRDRRARAEQLDTSRLVRREQHARARGEHGSAELHGLAYHRAIAGRLDEQIIAEARERLARWQEEGRVDPRYIAAWQRVLAQPPEQIASLIGEDTQRARDLRQASPLAGLLSEPERRRVLDLVRSAAR